MNVMDEVWAAGCVRSLWKQRVQKGDRGLGCVVLLAIVGFGWMAQIRGNCLSHIQSMSSGGGRDAMGQASGSCGCGEHAAAVKAAGPVNGWMGDGRTGMGEWERCG